MPHTTTDPAARIAGVHNDVDPRGDVALLAAYVAGDRAAFDEIDSRHRHVGQPRRPVRLEHDLPGSDALHGLTGGRRGEGWIGAA